MAAVYVAIQPFSRTRFLEALPPQKSRALAYVEYAINGFNIFAAVIFVVTFKRLLAQYATVERYD